MLEGVANGLWELSEEWSLDPGFKKVACKGKTIEIVNSKCKKKIGMS